MEVTDKGGLQTPSNKAQHDIVDNTSTDKLGSTQTGNINREESTKGEMGEEITSGTIDRDQDKELQLTEGKEKLVRDNKQSEEEDNMSTTKKTNDRDTLANGDGEVRSIERGNT